MTADTWHQRPSTLLNLPQSMPGALLLDIMAAQWLLSERQAASTKTGASHRQAQGKIEPEMMQRINEQIARQRKPPQ